MKLVKCYIENFGGLTKYEINFKPGITVIEEPNGFGKTTLAEFIRAMFYGFPRGSKTLEKNTRKKYLPWQGGKFGGNLVFEHNGKEYRIDRTFGNVPRLDTFSICDAKTRQKSLDFTENIGLELFGLDVDSFERSTYMPQLLDGTVLATTGIQAKLGNLVEDTNDINNYDKAVNALKSKRSSYIPFRGNGGAVADDVAHISSLYSELENSDSIYEQLQQAHGDMTELKNQRQLKESALENIRKEITKAAQCAARESILQQYNGMKKRQKKNADDLEMLKRRYPHGIPSEEELKEIAPLYDQIVALDNQITHSQADEDARAVVDANKLRFSQGLPTDAQIHAQQGNCKACFTKEAALENTGLSDYEKVTLSQLEKLFVNGAPEESFLDDCQSKSAHLQHLKTELDTQSMSPEAQSKLQNLKAFFAAGVPDENILHQKQENLDRANSLRDENVSITAEQVQKVQSKSELETPKRSAVPVIFILAIATLVVGTFMMVQKNYAAGGICLGIGVLAVIAVVYLKLKQDVSSSLSQAQSGVASISDSERERIRMNEQQITALEADVLQFVAQYITDNRGLSEKLHDIRVKRSEYIQLSEEETNFQKSVLEITSQISKLDSELRGELSEYLSNDIKFDAGISALREKVSQYHSLREKKRVGEETATEISADLEKLYQGIADFLRPYCGDVVPAMFSNALVTLQSDCYAYRTAQQQMKGRTEQLHQREEALQKCEAQIKEFNGRFYLHLDLHDRSSYENLRDDAKDYSDLLSQTVEDKGTISAFFEKNKESLTAVQEDAPKDIDGLKLAEKHLQSEKTKLDTQILTQDQLIHRLQTEADQIPEKQDELSFWKEKQKNDTRDSQLLDETIRFLSEAKESLSDNYLGKIKKSFSAYIQRLSGENAENVVIGTNLNVQMERLGEPRELGYFSVGQTDMVVLCMRLALVDALFEDAKPFIILDDPFVNLDDEHTKQAIAMMQELGNDHQIIYLVCNSSRTIPNSES